MKAKKKAKPLYEKIDFSSWCLMALIVLLAWAGIPAIIDIIHGLYTRIFL